MLMSLAADDGLTSDDEGIKFLPPDYIAL